MCGITGAFHYRGGQADLDLVKRQADLIRHRGPDDSGAWGEGEVALGHRRLSIVDLSPGGHQPMFNEDESVVVVFNGELYNWPELRPGLAARGHRFHGASDTEALLHLYEEHGEGLLERINGMFAFALFDRRRKRLLLARDRVGKKPLYYHDDGKRIVFASELKALMIDPTVPRDVDEKAIAEFLTFQYVPSPRSIWQGVRKLPPGHYLSCDERGARVKPYWTLPVEAAEAPPEGECLERLQDLLRDAVRMRLMSDVPLGAFLSGGIDSSAVVALMSQVMEEPVKTFSIGFEDEDVSELVHARRVAEHLGTDHHEFIVRPRALDVLPRLIWQMDEPFADASMIPTHYVSEMARRQVTVVLSGDGGDEAFGGYRTYAWARDYSRVDWMPRGLRRWASVPAKVLHPDHPLGRKLHRVSLDVVDRHLQVMAFFPPRELRGVLSRPLLESVNGHDPFGDARRVHARAARVLGDVPALLYLDALTYMTDDVLVKVDRASMMHSLEVRAPLLDHHVLEYVARMPFEYKLRGNTTKWMLRECVRNLLPAESLQRGKQGFGIPLDRWLRGTFGALAREVLLDPVAIRRGWYDRRAVERLLHHAEGRETRRSRQLWALVCLELWAQTYVDRPREALAAPLERDLIIGGSMPGPAAA